MSIDYFLETDTLSLIQTLEGGQAFRWAHEGNIFSGFAKNRFLRVRQENNGIIKQFSSDEILKKASEANRGLRILRQEPFETLISFIISQNNNIPRIKGIVSRLCESFGEKCGDGYLFPTIEKLASLSEEDLAPLRAGFRNRYILDAARKTMDKTVDLEKIYEMTYDEGKNELKKIVGVGDKVADCVLLFAYHKTEAFPMDVWIKRIVAEHYPDGLPDCMGGYKGIAQQYLFEYFRNHS